MQRQVHHRLVVMKRAISTQTDNNSMLHDLIETASIYVQHSGDEWASKVRRGGSGEEAVMIGKNGNAPSNSKSSLRFSGRGGTELLASSAQTLGTYPTVHNGLTSVTENSGKRSDIHTDRHTHTHTHTHRERERQAELWLRVTC